MVAAAMFWILLSFATALYLVLFCIKRGLSGNKFLDSLLDSLKIGNNNLMTNNKLKKDLDGPISLPLIGSLYKLGGPGGPFEAFTKLSKRYGDIYEMKLGNVNCVVVSSYRLIKEVLITKGGHFGGRPDLLRFHYLFGGDRNNSLALCDWSDLQRKRRSIARTFCSPRGGSTQQEKISQVAIDEVAELYNHLQDKRNENVLNGKMPVKPIILTAIGNMFTRYMCSKRFGYDHQQFNNVVRVFDEIFWDINQGYVVDYLPWLKMFYTKHLHRLTDWANFIRGFILDEIIEPKRNKLDQNIDIAQDFTDALLIHLKSPKSELSWDHILFELEDFLGGHSAVGNLVMMILANVVTYPKVQEKIQAECDAVLLKNGTEFISPNDRSELVYTEAVVWETLRCASSPIVPHVSTCDTEVGGYTIPKDTTVFLNNYNLNLGEEYWGEDAMEFKPERFIVTERIEGGGDDKSVMRVKRPDYFIPFSTGKRTCIGQKLVQGFAFVVVAMILNKYNVSGPPNVKVRSTIQPSCLALPPECFNLVLTHRKSLTSLLTSSTSL